MNFNFFFFLILLSPQIPLVIGGHPQMISRDEGVSRICDKLYIFIKIIWEKLDKKFESEISYFQRHYLLITPNLSCVFSYDCVGEFLSRI
jgi:hypothetical protein